MVKGWNWGKGASCSRGVMPLSQTVMTLIGGIARARERYPFRRRLARQGGAEKAQVYQPESPLTMHARRQQGRFSSSGWSKRYARAVSTSESAGEGRNSGTQQSESAELSRGRWVSVEAPVVSSVGYPHVEEATEESRSATASTRINQQVRNQLISLDPV